MSNWLNRGYDKGDAAREAEEARRNSNKDKTRRFWIPPEKPVRITFVDGDNPPIFREHNVQLNGHWKNWFFCVQGMPVLDDKGKPTGKTRTCPLCAAGDLSYFAAAYTIIDHSGWEDRDGNWHEDEVRLLVVKDEVYAILSAQHTKRKGLPGLTYEVTRTGTLKPSTGNNFDFEGRCEDGTLDDVEPLDYEAEFMPLADDVLEEIARQFVPRSKKGGGKDDKGKGGRGGGRGGGREERRGGGREERRGREEHDDRPPARRGSYGGGGGGGRQRDEGYGGGGRSRDGGRDEDDNYGGDDDIPF